MPVFLDTRGNPSLGIAVCGRCGIKMPRGELFSDPNTPGLMVCKDDLDVLDPYRLAPRETENITMEWVRPDASLNIHSPMPIYVPPPLTQVWLNAGPGDYITDDYGNAISLGPSGVPYGSPIPIPPQINPTIPWQANTVYTPGDSIVPLNPNDPNVQLPQYQFVCIFGGKSGVAPPPKWPNSGGVVFAQDGTVTWLCWGINIDEGIGTQFAAPKPGNVPPVQPVTGLFNAGGFLALQAPYPPNYSTSLPSAPGAIWNNGGFVCVVPGYIFGGPPLIFGQINASYLLRVGGFRLGPAPSSTLVLWNNGGFVCIS